jgi:peptidase S58-like protein
VRWQKWRCRDVMPCMRAPWSQVPPRPARCSSATRPVHRRRPRARAGIACAREFGVTPGNFGTGKLNAITDLAGVAVGHVTLNRGADVRTGVTAILPHGGNPFQEKVPGAVEPGPDHGYQRGGDDAWGAGAGQRPQFMQDQVGGRQHRAYRHARRYGPARVRVRRPRRSSGHGRPATDGAPRSRLSRPPPPIERSPCPTSMSASRCARAPCRIDNTLTARLVTAMTAPTGSNWPGVTPGQVRHAATAATASNPSPKIVYQCPAPWPMTIKRTNPGGHDSSQVRRAVCGAVRTSPTSLSCERTRQNGRRPSSTTQRSSGSGR